MDRRLATSRASCVSMSGPTHRSGARSRRLGGVLGTRNDALAADRQVFAWSAGYGVFCCRCRHFVIEQPLRAGYGEAAAGGEPQRDQYDQGEL
jgi:hypothetical protein